MNLKHEQVIITEWHFGIPDTLGRVVMKTNSPRKLGFAPRSVHVGFVVNKVALGQVLLRACSVPPCQYHSTAASYSLIYHVGDGQRARQWPGSTETQSHPTAAVTMETSGSRKSRTDHHHVMRAVCMQGQWVRIARCYFSAVISGPEYKITLLSHRSPDRFLPMFLFSFSPFLSSFICV
jgi:hypothetical protein